MHTRTHKFPSPSNFVQQPNPFGLLKSFYIGQFILAVHKVRRMQEHMSTMSGKLLASFSKNPEAPQQHANFYLRALPGPGSIVENVEVAADLEDRGELQARAIKHYLKSEQNPVCGYTCKDNFIKQNKFGHQWP
jgi:hypothetical protein